MAVLTPQDPRTGTGVAPVKTAANAGGDTIPMRHGKTYMIKFVNGAGAPQTVNINTPTSGGTQIETTYAIPATSERVFVVSRDYHGAQTVDVALTYSAVVTLTVEVYGPLPTEARFG